MEARKYPGVIAPITATSLRQTALQKPEKPFMAFGRMTELARKGVARFDRYFQDAVIEGFPYKSTYLLHWLVRRMRIEILNSQLRQEKCYNAHATKMIQSN
jgi:hypothetical protein